MNEKNLNSCEPNEHLLVLCAWDELDEAARAALDEHVKKCAACAAALAREIRLRHALVARPEPAPLLDPSDLFLAQCRSELAEALDDTSEKHGRRWLAWLRPSEWFLLRPSWTAALLVLVGIGLGTVVPQWVSAPGGVSTAGITTVSAPRITDQDLANLGVERINWVSEPGSDKPLVRLDLTSEKTLPLEGPADDVDVQRVLTLVVVNGQRFDPGVRLDSVDVLRTRASDAAVRQALCHAARGDRNPGVRLKALEALRGFEQDELVRATLLAALTQDDNPGVRIEAINSLQATFEALAQRGHTQALQDQRLVDALRDRMRKDPNNYVRLQSAAALRQIGPRQSY